MSPRECCASTLPAPAALVIAEADGLGDAAVDEGVFDAGAGVVAAGALVAGIDADPAADPAVERAVDAARGGI